MKKISILLVLICLVSQKLSAQNAEVKVNVAAAALTIFNPSFEIGFLKSSALTMDYVGAFADREFLNSGNSFVLSMGVLGYRHYLKPYEFKGFFIGPDLGFNTFRMNKNLAPFVDDHYPDDVYDVGFSVIIGGTAGYKFIFKERWGLEFNVSYGWQHAWHEGYDSEGVRQTRMNPSAEWLPYKAAINLSYRLFNLENK